MPLPLVARLKSVEFGVPVDAAGFDAVLSAGTLEALLAASRAGRHVEFGGGADRSSRPSTPAPESPSAGGNLGSRRSSLGDVAAAASSPSAANTGGNEPATGIEHLERSVTALVRSLGAVPSRPRVPAGDEESLKSYVACSELGGVAPRSRTAALPLLCRRFLRQRSPSPRVAPGAGCVVLGRCGHLL